MHWIIIRGVSIIWDIQDMGDVVRDTWETAETLRATKHVIISLLAADGPASISGALWSSL